MTFLITLAILAFLFFIYKAWVGYHPRRSDWRPPELANAKIVLVEQDLFTRYPYAIAGRPDQVYQLSSNHVVPVEYKTRSHFAPYKTDVAELSLQAWLMRRNGMKTANHGYVTIQQRETGQRKAIPVTLWSDDRCHALIERYLAIREGRATPRKANNGRCKGCGHSRYC